MKKINFFYKMGKRKNAKKDSKKKHVKDIKIFRENKSQNYLSI